MACLHLMADTLDCAIFVDTGLAYPETLALVEYAARIVPMHIVRSDRRGQNEREGLPYDIVPVNWTRLGHLVHGEKQAMIQSYHGCCFENIVMPLMKKAAELGVTELVFGQRNEESHKSTSRDGDVVMGIKRLQPIEEWTEAQVFDYLRTKIAIPEHYSIGHSSLDCYDCTGYRKVSADRIQWTKEKHADFYKAYRERRDLIDRALSEAL